MHPSMGRPLVVALCPAGEPPWEGRALDNSASGARLARMCGLSCLSELFERVETVNLLTRNPGALWPMLEARERALEIFNDSVEPNRKVILLGRAVHDAFGFLNSRVAGMGLFEWTRTSGAWWARSPHPSGLSRSWNDPKVKQAGESFWRSVVR